MTVPWQIDRASKDLIWSRLNETPLRILDEFPMPKVLDVGGYDGSLTFPLVRRGARVVVLDVDLEALRRVPVGAHAVRADVLHLPFRDGAFHGVTARATLHHVPDRLDEALAEIHRVMTPGGLFIAQEPLAGNPVYDLARRWFPTSWHDPDERPLTWEGYQAAISRRWRLREVSPHFLLTYLAPFVVARLRAGRSLIAVLDRVDRMMLRALPGLAPLAAYIHVLGRKQDPSVP